MTITLMPSENGETLRRIRQNLRMSQAEFAKKLGVTRERYKNWEYGAAEPPGNVMQTAESMSEYRKVDLESLPMARIRVVGSASAGAGSEIHPEFESAWVPKHMAQLDSSGWVAEGDSMMPWIQYGDVVVAKDCKTPRINYPFMVRRPDGAVSVKIIAFDGTQYLYRSLNPRYPDEPAEGELIGYVIGIYRIQGSTESILFDPNGLRPSDNLV